MHRWPGSSEDSSNQKSERNQRAARRTIKTLNLNPLSSEDEEVFQDCDTSFSLNVDGEPGDVPLVEPDMNANQQAAAAALAAEKRKPVQDADFDDDSDAWKKEIKVKFNPHDVKYWFNSVESAMKKFGINQQWSKKDAIVPLLPDAVVEECMPILRLSETEAGPHIYKDLKEEILQLYGPRDEDIFEKAIALRLTSTPSALGKKLVHFFFFLVCLSLTWMSRPNCDQNT